MESEEQRLELLREQNQILRVIAAALCCAVESEKLKSFQWMDQELTLLATFRPDK